MNLVHHLTDSGILYQPQIDFSGAQFSLHETDCRHIGKAEPHHVIRCRKFLRLIRFTDDMVTSVFNPALHGTYVLDCQMFFIAGSEHTVRKGMGHMADRIQFKRDFHGLPFFSQRIHDFKTIGRAQMCFPEAELTLKDFSGSGEPGLGKFHRVYGAVGSPAGMYLLYPAAIPEKFLYGCGLTSADSQGIHQCLLGYMEQFSCHTGSRKRCHDACAVIPDVMESSFRRQSQPYNNLPSCNDCFKDLFAGCTGRLSHSDCRTDHRSAGMDDSSHMRIVIV